MSIILGIDPGSRITGFGAIRLHQLKSASFETLGYGVIQMDPRQPFALRMKELGCSLQQVLKKYKPDAVAIEKIFLGKNADSAFKLGHARGVAMYESVLAEAQVFEYATRVVKKGITGKGGASKEEVQVVLERLLGLRQISRIDASDALALAAHHAFAVMSEKSLQRGLAASKRSASDKSTEY